MWWVFKAATPNWTGQWILRSHISNTKCDKCAQKSVDLHMHRTIHRAVHCLFILKSVFVHVWVVMCMCVCGDNMYVVCYTHRRAYQFFFFFISSIDSDLSDYQCNTIDRRCRYGLTISRYCLIYNDSVEERIQSLAQK